jgi:Pin2-interacting protein X1
MSPRPRPVSVTASTSVSLLQLSGRKHKSRMGADLNESVATGPNAFARAQLEKLGWKEGTGLGKNRDGRADHIRVTKRRDEQGLGAASLEIDPVVTGDQWWKSSVGNTLARLAAAKKEKKSKKKKKKKRKLEYTDEELFEATGGARFGMRAQTQQKGKWNRAEDGITSDQEETALRSTEWDGMAAPKVLLSTKDETKKKKKKKHQKEEKDSSAAPNEQEEEGETRKAKRRKTTPSSKEFSSSESESKEKKKKKDKKSKSSSSKKKKKD